MGDKDILNELDLLVIEGQRLERFDDFFGQRLLKLYQLKILDPFVYSSIKDRVEGDIRKYLLSGLPFYHPRLRQGNLVFGFGQDGSPYLIPIQYLNAGCLEVAGTGAGKTNRAMFYAIQIAPHVQGMWLVDLRKAEFRLLRRVLAKKGIDLKIVRGRKFRINPLQVPYQVHPESWASQIADCLVRVLNLPPRASILLQTAIMKLYRQHGIFNGSQNYPTIFSLFEAIRTDRTANPQARQAVIDSLELVLLSLGAEVLAYHRGWTADQLAKQFLAIELSMLPEVCKDLILNWLIMAEFSSRIAQGISNQAMNLWVYFDEGQRFFSQRKEVQSQHGNAITDQAGLVRGTGIGLSISVLSTNDLANQIPNLTSTKIIGRCGSLAEYTTAGHFMGLNQEQINWCMHHMVPGLFAGQVAEGKWRYPFIFAIPLFNKSQIDTVTDEEADRSIEDLDAGDIVPAAIANRDGIEIPHEDQKTDTQKTSVTSEELTPAEFKLVSAVVESPMRVSSDYVKLAGISPNTLRKLRPILIEKGLIKEHCSEGSVRGRTARRWEPLDAARLAVEKSTNNRSKK